MVKVGKKIAKHRIAILIIGFLLLIPSAFGYFNTRVNYDILYYLPDNIDTMKGQEILMDDFGKGAFAIEVVEGMTTKEVTDVKKKIEAVDGVADVIWYDSISDLSVPIDSLPDKIKDIFQKDDSTLMAIFFDRHSDTEHKEYRKNPAICTESKNNGCKYHGDQHVHRSLFFGECLDIRYDC